MSSELSTAIYSDDLFPRHIRERFPALVQFIRKYYDWMEEDGNLNSTLHKFGNITTREFLLENYELIRREYLRNYPSDVFVDKEIFVKGVRDLYAAKGNYRAIKTFFRILFNEEVTIRLPPGRAILPFNRPIIFTYAVEQNPSSVRIDQITATVGNWVEQGIVSGYVESVKAYTIANRTVFEFRLSNIKNGEFQQNIPIEIIQAGTSYTPVIILGTAEVLNPGTGYAVGEDVIIPASGSLATAIGRISEVGPNGEIQSVSVINPGIDYPSSQVTSNISTENGSGASIRFNATGQYDATQGVQIDATQDTYEYIIESSVPAAVWGNLLRDTVHPAGVGFRGEISVDEEVTSDAGSLTLQLYARELDEGGVNYNNPNYASSREFFYPQIIMYPNDTRYDLSSKMDISFDQFFDPNNAIFNSFDGYQYGTGTYGEFPVDYFRVDLRIRNERPFEFSEFSRDRVLKLTPTIYQVMRASDYLSGYADLEIGYVDGIYGVTEEDHLVWNAKHERSNLFLRIE